MNAADFPAPDPYTVLRVTWRDACSAMGWMSPEEACERQLTEVVSVGMYMTSDHDRLVMVADTDGDNVNGVGCIPWGNIVAVAPLVHPAPTIALDDFGLLQH